MNIRYGVVEESNIIPSGNYCWSRHDEIKSVYRVVKNVGCPIDSSADLQRVIGRWNGGNVEELDFEGGNTARCWGPPCVQR